MATATKRIITEEVPVTKYEKREKEVGVTLELSFEEATYILTILGRCNQFVADGIGSQLIKLNIPRCDGLILRLFEDQKKVDISPNERGLLHVAVKKAGLGTE